MNIQHKSNTAEVYGSAGENARIKGVLSVLWPVLLLVLIVGYLMGLAFPLKQIPMSALGLVLVFSAGLFAWVFMWSEAKLGNYLKGAHGEEAVARMLSRLPAEYVVFHSLPLQFTGAKAKGDIDHLVIGPDVVYMIDTKNWSGQPSLIAGEIHYDGSMVTRPPVSSLEESKADFEAYIKGQLNLSIKVSPIICFVNNHIENSPLMTGDKLICDGGSLMSVFKPTLEGVALAEVERTALIKLCKELVS